MMWEVKITTFYCNINIELYFNEKPVISEYDLSVHTDKKLSTLYYGTTYNDSYKSDLWNYIHSLYKEFILYRKYKIIDDLYLENNVMKRYCGDLLISVDFSEKFVDNVIDEVESMCVYINCCPCLTYDYYFTV